MVDPFFRLRMIVEGHVQGVGFRFFVDRLAQELNLTGWVRNLENGNVEITAEGEKNILEHFLSLVSEGPTGSTVLNVKHEWLPADNTFTRFTIRPTF
jgi:acylphosphatase